MTEQAIMTELASKIGVIAKEIHRGKDVEIKTSNGGVKIYSIDKKVVK
jgi:hypothetical protein